MPYDDRCPGYRMSDCRPDSAMAVLKVGAFKNKAVAGVFALIKSAIRTESALSTRYLVCPETVRHTSSDPEKMSEAKMRVASAGKYFPFFASQERAIAISGIDATNQ